MKNTVAWMIAGGRRFDARWSETVRHRLALEEGRSARPSRLSAAAMRVRETFAPKPASAPDCCAA